MKIFRNSCSLDCFDVCKIDVYKKDGRVVKLEGSRDNSLTDGFLCSKGLKHLNRLYDENRILKPLLKVGEGFKEISFEDAIEIVNSKLIKIKKDGLTNSIIHYSESGAGGLLKGIHDIFFNFLGGISTATGGTCWSAGCAAHDYDFGGRQTSDLDDMKNANVIILWSRNPAVTSVHLYKKLVEMKKLGIKIVTIDFRKNETSTISDLHINLRAGGDGALALALSRLALEKNTVDRNFIDENIYGFEKFSKYLSTLNMNELIEECGVSSEKINELFKLISIGNVMTFIGYGMQRYINGGNNVRAIDALMSMTGNIGKSGAGVFYSSKIYPQILNRDPYLSLNYAINSREFAITNFANFVKENTIEAIFISKANPLNQLPDLNKTLDAYKSIPFKVCFDMFLTDTAKNSDLIIPVTNTLESEDIIYSSMLMPSLMYNEKVVDPETKEMDEYFFFQSLAKKMNLKSYPIVSKEEYLNKVLAPLNITLDDLKKRDINIQKGHVAWEDKKFNTPSGKIEIYSETALKDGAEPMPILMKASKNSSEYPIRLITPHAKNSLFNQHVGDIEDISQIFISHENSEKLEEGDIVLVSSKNGSIKSKIKFDFDLKKDEAYIFMQWSKAQGNPNFLTNSLASDIGGQVAYYDTFINIKKISV
ncbi:molybdopterin-dependent oxidoreductase [Cetobacterium sp. ZOR0034]|uniref:molybdopterin-dependent oxidoreductase n=1 Tax=Cetobacterium sp. ZOR0034 TaxID=1339239 RepID=UPI000645F573|nr:molybdopterin-dependent oxidoreductase [Cetobacterium sp. ZOR0034]